MKKLILLTILVGLLTVPALANLTNTRPVGTAASLSEVQGTFGTIGSTLDAVADQSNAAIFAPMAGGSSASTYIATVSWNASDIEFGIYEYGDSTNKVKLFDWTTGGTLNPGDSVSFVFNPGAGTVTSFDPGGTIDSTTSYFDNFGFYAISTYGTFYSEDSLNGGNAQMLAYEGNGDTVTIGGLTGSDSEHWYIATEATSGGSRDFSDMIVLVESITPVIPAPGAVVLGSIGVAFVGWLRRRRTL